jgi:hypothetical protein
MIILRDMVHDEEEKTPSDDAEFDHVSELKRSERWLSGFFGVIVMASGIGAVYKRAIKRGLQLWS